MFLDCDLLKISILFVIWSWLFEISIVAPNWSWIFVCKSTVSLWVPFVFNWDSWSNSFEVQLFSSFRLAAAASRICKNIFPRISVVWVFPSTFFTFSTCGGRSGIFLFPRFFVCSTRVSRYNFSFFSNLQPLQVGKNMIRDGINCRKWTFRRLAATASRIFGGECTISQGLVVTLWQLVAKALSTPRARGGSPLQ